MARLVIVTDPDSDYTSERFYLSRFEETWRARGHEVIVAVGLDALPDGDIAILHVDLSVVPEEYVAACKKKYPRVLNGGATDVRKRAVSRDLVQRGDGYEGPVILKTDLNSGGLPEAQLIRNRERAGREPPASLLGLAGSNRPYPIFRSVHQVPEPLWEKRGVVVERFLPERDERGFRLRVWTFLGGRGRSSVYLSASPIVKSTNITSREPCAVPDELRAERARLGFDYGKFDFVISAGRVVLLDVNKTPSVPAEPWATVLGPSDAELALGIEELE